MEGSRRPGIGDPIADFADVELELVLWYTKMFSSNLGKIAKAAKLPGADMGTAVAEVMQGIGVKKEHVNFALKEALLEEKDIESWNEKETQNFCWILRDVSKPTLIIANKMDLPNAAENFKKLREHYKDLIVVPTSGEAELSLRRAESKGCIKYVPGEERFDVIKPQELTVAQQTASGIHQEEGLRRVPEDRGPVRPQHSDIQAAQDERHLPGGRPGEADRQERERPARRLSAPDGVHPRRPCEDGPHRPAQGPPLRGRCQDRNPPSHRLRPERQGRAFDRLDREKGLGRARVGLAWRDQSGPGRNSY